MTSLSLDLAPMRLFPGDDVLAIEPSALSRQWPPAALALGYPLRPIALVAPEGDEADGAPAAGTYDDDDYAHDGNQYADGVGTVCIEGPLCQRGGYWWDGYAAIQRRFVSALTNPACQVVVLQINSPGGYAAGCFEAVRQMRADASAVGKTVLCFVDECAASAAYALACVADEIWVPSPGAVGSVGVIATYLDASKAVAEAGLRFLLLTSGKAKGDGHPTQAISREMAERLRVPVDHLAGLFFAWVGERRRMTPAAVEALEAEVFWGRDGLAKGLADRVASKEDCFAYARALAAAPAGSAFPRTSSRAASPAAAPEVSMSTSTEAQADTSAAPAPTAPQTLAAEAPASEPSLVQGALAKILSAGVLNDAEVAALASLVSQPAAPAVMLESTFEPLAPMVAKAEHDAVVAALQSTIGAKDEQLSQLIQERDRLRSELAAEKAKVGEYEAKRLERKVDDAVGEKILPSQRDAFLALIKTSEAQYDAIVASLPPLGLNGQRVIADDPPRARATDSQEGNVKLLNDMAAEHMKLHSCSRADALRAVMLARPDLCGSN